MARMQERATARTGARRTMEDTPRARVATQMRTEIAQQPEALRRTLDALLPRVEEITSAADGARQVLFIARGTSANAAAYGSYLVQVPAGRLPPLAPPPVAPAHRPRAGLSGGTPLGHRPPGRP